MSDREVLRRGARRYDAIIVGGGPAGCGAAIGFARAGARVLLLDRQPRPIFKPGEIIDPSVRQPLASLGLLERFPASGSLASAGRLIAWDDAAASEAPGVLNPQGHGFVVDRADMDRWLLCEASSAGVTAVQGAATLHAACTERGWTVAWHADNRPLSAEAPLLVEATGCGPGVLGYGRRLHLHRLVALVAYVPAPTEVGDQRLIIEAAVDGWWYGTLLPGRRVALAFVTDACNLPIGPSTRRAWWHARLVATAHVQRLVATASVEEAPIRGFPAGSSIRETLSGRGWVAIGEAAAAYDPLTGQGVAAALAKGAALARLVVSGTDLTAAVTAYAAAERKTFARYASGRRRIYARAARRFVSPFWHRHGSPDE